MYTPPQPPREDELIIPSSLSHSPRKFSTQKRLVLRESFWLNKILLNVKYFFEKSTFKIIQHHHEKFQYLPLVLESPAEKLHKFVWLTSESPDAPSLNHVISENVAIP